MIKKGFTLIELMFLVVVISILSLYTLTNLHARVNTTALSKTAVEMKTLLEASLAYYADQHCNEQHCWATDINQLIQAGYLPAFAYCSPWLLTFDRQAQDSQIVSQQVEQNELCPTKAQYEIQQHGLFAAIKVQLPNRHLAQLLKSRMPSAQIENTTTVVAATRIPGELKGWLTEAGLTNNGGKIYLPDCPPGYEGHYVEFPQHQTTGYGTKSIEGLSAVNIYQTKNQPEHMLYSYSLKAYNKVESPVWTKKDYAYYLAFCVPKGKWSVSSSAAQNDTQLAFSWLEYNNQG